MGVETSSGQVLEFLTVTSLPYRGANDEEARRIVRSHAIRDANRRKRLKHPVETKKTKVSAVTAPPPQSSLTTKFKLNKKPPKGKKKPLDEYEEYMERRLVKQAAWGSVHPEIGIMIGAGLFDPFQSLPIKVGPRQEVLLDYRMWISVYSYLDITYLDPFVFQLRLLTLICREISTRPVRVHHRLEGMLVCLCSYGSGMVERYTVPDITALRPPSGKRHLS
jgi:hypothetical protein